ncbi:MAG: T9SS type A sorting domain-containing protein [Bacteroidetes bacterium]|nr:T9SS type A sorting domain-containing protein [Bacteroidota bacterium]
MSFRLRTIFYLLLVTGLSFNSGFAFPEGKSTSVTKNHKKTKLDQSSFSKLLKGENEKSILKSIKKERISQEEKTSFKEKRNQDNFFAKSKFNRIQLVDPVYSENFETTANGQKPSGWVISYLGDSGYGFKVGSDSYALDTGNDSKYLLADDDDAGESVSLHTTALSPALNVSGATKSVVLSIFHDFEQEDGVPSFGKVFVVVNGVSHLVATFDETTSWTTSQIDLSAYALSANSINLKFEYSDGDDWAWGWGIDDIKVFVDAGDLTPPEVSVEPYAFTTAKTIPIPVSATVTDSDSGVDSVVLNYGFAEEGPFTSVEMSSSGQSVWSAEIPGQEGNTDVYFYIEAVDVSGNCTKSEIEGYTIESLFVTPYAESFDLDDFSASLWIYEGDHYLGLVGTDDSYGIGSNLWSESQFFQLVTTHFAPAPDLKFSFQYRIQEYADNGDLLNPEIITAPAYDLQDGDSISVWALIDDEVWFHLGSITSLTHSSNTDFVEMKYDLSAFTSNTIQLHFLGYHGGGVGDFLFIADNYELKSEKGDPVDTTKVTLHFPSSDSVAVGSLIRVPVYTTPLNGLEVFAMDCSVTYDPAILTYSKVIIAGTLSSGMATAVNFSKPGTLTLSAAQATALSGSDSVLILFEFRGKALGNTQLSFTKALFNDGVPSVKTVPGTIHVVLSTDVAEKEMPTSFMVHGNYPNPFNPTTKLSYGIPQPGLVSVVVFNALGQEVANLGTGKKLPAGNHELEFDASDFGSGVYFYQIRFGNQVKTGKMVLTK